MGHSERPTAGRKKQAGTRNRKRKPRQRRCLLKGCEQRFRPRHARQRYCSAACREGARDWSRWKARQRYRATKAGKQKRNHQSRRYRERVRARESPPPPAAAEPARVIPKNFFRAHLRPSGMLRALPSKPAQPAAALLLARLPARIGTRMGTRTAPAAHAGRPDATPHPHTAEMIRTY